MTHVSLDELSSIIKNLKKEGKKVVITNGCFDILHVGHIRYLKEAKKLGDVLIVGVNSDKSVRILKGNHRPITPEKERAEIIDSLKCVDYVILFSEKNPNYLIEKIKPDVHVKGGDYEINDIPESKLMNSIGGKTIILKKINGKSSSNIIKKICEIKARKKI